jgi:hypothetical protein
MMREKTMIGKVNKIGSFIMGKRCLKPECKDCIWRVDAECVHPDCRHTEYIDDCLIVAYDHYSSDIPTLSVVKKERDKIKVVNTIQGYAATNMYDHLTRGMGSIFDKSARKPIGDLNSVPHYRCPSCFGAVVMCDKDPHYPCCQWCGQKLDWNDNKSHETKEEVLLVDDLFPNGYGIQHQKPLKISFKGEEE